MRRIYVDTEYMYEGMRVKKRKPRADDEKQIIQIAAVEFDHAKGEEISFFDMLVKPAFGGALPAFFTELTGIDDAMVAFAGVSFPDALHAFVDFCGSTPIWTFDNDFAVFKQNVGYYSIPNPFAAPFIRVKPLLKNYGLDPEAYSSGTLYKAAGLFMTGHPHNALHDVRSMSRALYAFDHAV